MKFKARSGWIAAAMALAGTFATAAPDPVKIGLVVPLSGGSSPIGVSVRDGVRLAVSEINARGGVLARPIQLVERDDESKNERGVQIAQEFVNKEKVAAVIGFVNTGPALAAQRFYQEARIPAMTTTATGTVVTQQFRDQPDDYVFRVSASDAIQAAMMVDEAVGRRKFTRVALLADSTNYGQLGREDLLKALSGKGITPVVVEKFNVKDVDMTAQLLRAKEAGAEALLVYGVGPELAQIANGMQKLGWKVPMIGSWNLAMANFIDNAGANGDGATMPQTFIQDSDRPRHREFVQAYQKAFKVDRIPVPSPAAQAYDSTYLLAAAIRQAGVTDGPRVREALENLREPVQGVIATYDKPFAKGQHEAIDASIPVFGVVRGGRVVHADPQDKLRSAPRK
ncbi:MAG: amino acid ABC transporter substrate-binding protein [Variovorax sp.]|nr:MAG: amino acid ABC transporter substrate-binding protein [Variovorax sp.]